MRAFRNITLCVLGAAALWSAGCGLALSRLPSEDKVSRLAEMKEGGLAMAVRRTVVPTWRPGEGEVGIAVHETGSGGSESVIVLVHGVFADHTVWRFVTGELGRGHDLIMIDLPGCGESGAASFNEAGAYGPAALADRVLSALESRLAERPASTRLTIVGHSLGGAVAIDMACNPEHARRHAGALSRVDRLVLLSPLDVALEKPIPLFVELTKVNDVTVMVADGLGILQDRCAAAIVESCCDPELAVREEACKRMDVLRSSDHRRAMQAMIRDAVPWRAGRPDWEKIEGSVGHYANLRVPCTILWGARDEVLPLSMGYKLASELPGASLVILPRSMHSVQLDDPAGCAELILGSMDGRPAAAGSPFRVARVARTEVALH
jgi:pimeloyl-ACP methyl ester carboxylesterase